MSDARKVLVAVTALLGAGAATLEAQSDVQQLRRQYEALELRRAAAGKALDSLRRAVSRVLSDSLIAGGRQVRFVKEHVSASERAAIVLALEAEAARLRAEFGASASLLADNRPWDIEEYVVRRTATNEFRLEYQPAYGGLKYVFLDRPIDARPIEIVARSMAAGNATRLHPLTTRYVTDGATFDDSGDELARAAESLALSGSATGRRCAGGSIPDCRLVLGGASDKPYLERFFEPVDWPELVRRARRTPPNAPSPSTWAADRERCLEERTGEACEALVRVVPPRFPFGASVRATFFVEGVRLGGEAGLQRLVAARDEYANDPVGLMAHVAGVPADSLIARWRNRVIEQGRLASHDPIVPVFLTSLAWGGLLLMGATLRRPR
jgi:hypothetical protein